MSNALKVNLNPSTLNQHLPNTTNTPGYTFWCIYNTPLDAPEAYFPRTCPGSSVTYSPILLPTHQNQWNSGTCYYYLPILQFCLFSLTKYTCGWACFPHKSLSVDLRGPTINYRLIQASTRPLTDNISDGLQLPSGPEWRTSSHKEWTDEKERRRLCHLLHNETDFLVHRPMKLAVNDQMQLHSVWNAGAHECSSWWKRQHLSHLIFSNTVSQIHLDILWLYLLVWINTDDWFVFVTLLCLSMCNRHTFITYHINVHISVLLLSQVLAGSFVYW